MDEIFLGQGSNLTIQTSKNVELRETLVLLGGFDNNKFPTELEVKIIADFSTIPDEYHEVFLNMMTSKYFGRVSFGDNPFSKCLPPKKKRWYQFWK
jgi:hypothetical protein